jgi:hypothetical protein
VRWAGLFGSTFLSCEVADAVPQPRVEQRAGTWCSQVAGALNTAR